MPPLSAANPARPSRKHGPPRIVPVVPLPFSRPIHSARPMTPEETTPEFVNEPQHPAASAEHSADGQHDSKTHVPLTPDSRQSAPSPREGRRDTPESSLAGFREERPEHALEAQERLATPSLGCVEPAAVEQAVHPAGTTSSKSVDISNNSSGPLEHQPPDQPSEHPQALAEPLTKMPAHHPHPSVDSIVFGARTDSPSVPPTPQELEVDIRAPQPFSRPPPGFLVPQFSPFYLGHPRHQSDSSAPFLVPPMSLPPPPPPNATYVYNGKYPPATWPVHPGAYPPPYPPRFSPNQETGQMNGARHSPRSLSQSPVRSQTADTRAGSEREGDRHINRPSNGTSLPIPNNNSDDIPFELAAYLSSEFGRAEFADFVLQIHNGDLTLFSLPVHAIIVKRSRAIATAIQKCKASQSGGSRLPFIDIPTTDRFVSAQSLAEAVKHLYGAPFVSSEAFTWDLPPFQPHTQYISTHSPARLRMKQALSLVAAGFLLQLPSFSTRSMHLARKLLRWDTVDQVFHFALTAGSHSTDENGTDRTNNFESGKTHRGTYEALSTSLLGEILDFVAFSFPSAFQLYPAAPELLENPRLPSTVKHKPPTHNPRLSKIRFGDIPAEDDGKPVYVTRILSSLLLSLPFAWLDRLFAHFELGRRLGWQSVGELMKAVIEERENRRHRVLRGSIKPSSRGQLEEQGDDLSWEELVGPSTDHPAGVALIRRRVD